MQDSTYVLALQEPTEYCCKQQHVNTASLAQSFKFRIPMLWKTVPLDILQSPSLSLFKKKLKKWLLAADFMHFD
jgi:hypothetical protein